MFHILDSHSLAGSSEGGLSWTSSEAGDEVSLSPRSPSGEGDPEVNFTLGPTETTPYACHFCEKAFPRLSYLKKHEQVRRSHSSASPTEQTGETRVSIWLIEPYGLVPMSWGRVRKWALGKLIFLKGMDFSWHEMSDGDFCGQGCWGKGPSSAQTDWAGLILVTVRTLETSDWFFPSKEVKRGWFLSDKRKKNNRGFLDDCLQVESSFSGRRSSEGDIIRRGWRHEVNPWDKLLLWPGKCSKTSAHVFEGCL